MPASNMVGISSPAAVPINIPANFSGNCNSCTIYSGILIKYMLLAVHISVQAINSNNVSRRFCRGASSVAPPVLCTFGMEGNIFHTNAPQRIKAAAAARYITLKPNPKASAKAIGGPITQASET
ncbi:hypothetical protein D3C75_869650 [compost metagenome]